LINLGEKIYHRRVLKNITTKDIASRVSLSPEAYRNIEKGVTDLSFTTCLSIAKALDIPLQEFIADL
jgi:transcriptional regulator with XRE-family HTH domain